LKVGCNPRGSRVQSQCELEGRKRVCIMDMAILLQYLCEFVVQCLFAGQIRKDTVCDTIEQWEVRGRILECSCLSSSECQLRLRA